MFSESVRTERRCVSLIGCEKTRAALLVDPDLGETDRFLALTSSHAFGPDQSRRLGGVSLALGCCDTWGLSSPRVEALEQPQSPPRAVLGIH